MTRTFLGAWACWAMAAVVQTVGATHAAAQARQLDSDWPAESTAVHAVLLQFLKSRLGRRTLVFWREAGGCRIVHLHASNITVPSQ